MRSKLNTGIRVQVLVLCHEGDCHRPRLHCHSRNRCPRILAYPPHLLLYPIRHHHAPANPVKSPFTPVRLSSVHDSQTHDQVQVHPLRSWEEDAIWKEMTPVESVMLGSGQGGNGARGALTVIEYMINASSQISTAFCGPS